MAEENVCRGFQMTEEATYWSRQSQAKSSQRQEECFLFLLFPPLVDARLSCSSLHTCLQQETRWGTPSVCLAVGRGWAVALKTRLLGNFVAVIT